MNTLTRYGFGLSLIAAMTFQTPAALANESEIDLLSAEVFSLELLEFAHEQSIMGTFKRERPEFESLFKKADDLLEELFSNRSLHVETIEAEPSKVRLSIVDEESGKTFSVQSLQTPARQSTPGDPASFKYAIPGTHLIIEEAVRWENTSSGRFTTIAKGNADNPITRYARVESGVARGPFSLSFFGATAGDSIKVGVNARLQIKTAGGWTFTVWGQASENLTPDLNVTEGRYKVSATGLPHLMLSLQIDKIWAGTQIKTSAGVSVRWTGGKVYSDGPSATVNVAIGKSFKNSKGREVASLEAMAAANLGNKGPEWILSLRAVFNF
jgi:hypothetical protein